MFITRAAVGHCSTLTWILGLAWIALHTHTMGNLCTQGAAASNINSCTPYLLVSEYGRQLASWPAWSNQHACSYVLDGSTTKKYCSLDSSLVNIRSSLTRVSKNRSLTMISKNVLFIDRDISCPLTRISKNVLDLLMRSCSYPRVYCSLTGFLPGNLSEHGLTWYVCPSLNSAVPRPSRLPPTLSPVELDTNRGGLVITRVWHHFNETDISGGNHNTWWPIVEDAWIPPTQLMSHKLCSLTMPWAHYILSGHLNAN